MTNQKLSFEEEKKPFPILGCLNSLVMIVLGLLLAGGVSAALIPNVREYLLTSILRETATRFSSPEVPVTVDSTRYIDFKGKIETLASSKKVVEDIDFTEEELNAALKQKTDEESSTIEVRIKLKEREAKVFFKIKEKEMPWVEVTILNTNTGNLQLKDAKLGPLTLTAENMRETLKGYSKELSEFNFERLDEQLNKALLEGDSPYEIDTVDVYSGYMQVRFIKK